MGKEISVKQRLPRDAAWIFGVVSAVYAGILSAVYDGIGWDVRAYWLAWHGDMYTTAPGTRDAYLYSPAFAQAFWPLAQLPFPVAAVVFIVPLGIVLGWLLKPLGWKFALPLWFAGVLDMASGNIYILMALAAVYSFRRPELWAFAALTKISPCVGPVWFLARGEWTKLVRAAVATLAIAGVSIALAPSLWLDWFTFLWDMRAHSAGDVGTVGIPPAIVRVPLGIAFIVWAARKDYRWAIPVGMFICTPVLALGSATLLAAIPRIVKDQRDERASRTPSMTDHAATGS